MVSNKENLLELFTSIGYQNTDEVMARVRLQLVADGWDPNEYSDEELYRIAGFLEEQDYERILGLMDQKVDGLIVGFASLGTWQGPVSAGRICGSNLQECFRPNCNGDTLRVYVEGNELKADETHHDGENHYIYRLLDYDAVDKHEDDFYCMFRSYRFEEAMKYTVPLGDMVREVYGAW